jgi:arsenate reductase
MAELGIDISAQRPKPLTQRMIQQADRIIAMGCDVVDSSPMGFHPSEDWGLEDTRSQPLEKVRLIRAQIRERVLALLTDLGEPHSAEMI